MAHTTSCLLLTVWGCFFLFLSFLFYLFFGLVWFSFVWGDSDIASHVHLSCLLPPEVFLTTRHPLCLIPWLFLLHLTLGHFIASRTTVLTHRSALSLYIWTRKEGEGPLGRNTNDARRLAHTPSFSPHRDPSRQPCFRSHFADENMEGQRGSVPHLM